MSKQKLKIALLGGGSLYFEGVLGEIAVTPELDGAELVLFDIDAKRMELIRRVGVRVVEKTRAKLKIKSTLELAEALDGANFAIASIGVHGPDASWHKADSDIAAKLGIIQTTGDTVGLSGLSQGLRIVPIFVHIARQMEKYCPDAVLMNHSNPMAVICRAVTKYSRIKTIGYCHNVASDLRFIARILELDHQDLEAVFAGPNHCVWMWGLKYRGRDIFPQFKQRLMDALRDKSGTPLPPRPDGTGRSLDEHRFAAEMLELFDVFPIGGDRHIIEFFPHARRATDTKKIPYGLQWRSDIISDNMIKREISNEPDDIVLKASGKKPVYIPEKLSPEAMGQQIRSMMFGPERIHVVNIPNRGAVPNLPEWAVVELQATIGMTGARPIYVGNLPPQAARWSLAQIYAHELTLDAAVEGSRSKALMALACDPMIQNFDEARRGLDAIVKVHGSRMKAFRA